MTSPLHLKDGQEVGALPASQDRVTDASHGASRLSPPSGSVPTDAEDDGSYRMNPHFRRFLGVVVGMDRALAAWDVAREAFWPSDVDGAAEYEVWQGEEMVAGSSGPRRRALAEAVHYAVVYQTDEKPCRVVEVARREVSPEEAHLLIAKATGNPSPNTPDTGRIA